MLRSQRAKRAKRAKSNRLCPRFRRSIPFSLSPSLSLPLPSYLSSGDRPKTSAPRLSPDPRVRSKEARETRVTDPGRACKSIRALSKRSVLASLAVVVVDERPSVRNRESNRIISLQTARNISTVSIRQVRWGNHPERSESVPGPGSASGVLPSMRSTSTPISCAISCIARLGCSYVSLQRSVSLPRGKEGRFWRLIQRLNTV